MSNEILSPQPAAIRDEFLVVADIARELRVGEKLMPPSKETPQWTINEFGEDMRRVPPPEHAGLVVVARYKGYDPGWQEINEAKFHVPGREVGWTVNRCHDREVYENEYFLELLDVTHGFLLKPELVCVQAFAAYHHD